MSDPSWQKSSYCGTGEACVHVATAGPDAAVNVSGSPAPGDPYLTVSRPAWSAFLQTIKTG
ncbi:DUF397 domain-containing protein [Streptomyces erythrochromogenes]|uniref:DUF397 domain-containing protein n=1 Tax=Streptomyces erythrochromogenes TaxID=285574 RepID=UPI00368DA33E